MGDAALALTLYLTPGEALLLRNLISRTTVAGGWEDLFGRWLLVFRANGLPYGDGTLVNVISVGKHRE